MTKSNLKVVKSTKDQEMDIKEKNKALDAATESTTSTDIEPDLINVSVISNACSPVSG